MGDKVSQQTHFDLFLPLDHEFRDHHDHHLHLENLYTLGVLDDLVAHHSLVHPKIGNLWKNDPLSGI